MIHLYRLFFIFPFEQMENGASGELGQTARKLVEVETKTEQGSAIVLHQPMAETNVLAQMWTHLLAISNHVLLVNMF